MNIQTTQCAISHDCDSTEENIIKVIHFHYVPTLTLPKGPEPCARGQEFSY